MSIDINVKVDVNLTASQELVEFIKSLFRPTPIRIDAFVPETKPQTVLLSDKSEPTPPPEEIAEEAPEPVKKKTTKTKLSDEQHAAIRAAGEMLPPKGMTDPNTPEVKRTLDELRALCTNMASHQNFDVKAFLNNLGYQMMSGIPEHLITYVYNKAKELETEF